ncbi:hypothetical protein C8Q76DRAFT_781311 [Earliella scabrosa]|nr:hypothetical protein C8Q76DRAFT_781311 [Earliella scabrosa]
MVLPLAELVNQAPGRVEVLPPPFNCTNYPFIQSPQITVMLIVLSHGALAVADFIAVAVTWRKTYATYRSLPKANMKVSLTRILLYDGTIYFLVLSSVNIVHIAVTSSSVLHPSIISPDRTAFISRFVDILTAILTCRLILDLRRADRQLIGQSSTFSWVDPGNCGEYLDRRELESRPSFVAPGASPTMTGPFQDDDDLRRVYEELRHAETSRDNAHVVA